MGACKKLIEAFKKIVSTSSKALKVFEDMGAIYGNYKGTDGRLVPGVITQAFAQAGTVDIIVFDNQYSGGKHELTGISLGCDRGEFEPYIAAEDEADESIMAS